MTAQQIQSGLYEIAHKYEIEYTAQANALAPTAQNERKALLIAAQLAKHCADFTKMGENAEMREKRVFHQGLHYFDVQKSTYDSFSPQDKDCFLIYAFAVTMVRHCFYDRRLQMQGNATHNFENKVILGALDIIFQEWNTFWNAHGRLHCEAPQ